ncbi:MAG TPA: phosphate ABC transporter substrate-binding/OmpA family protein [Pirellulales bacterium]|nr:phosphate ABC transporter substrate-binding/OmpA family protein [Pirellulales bacterium]
MAAGQPKAPFFIALFLLVAALVAFGIYRFGERGGGDQPVPKTRPDLAKEHGGQGAGGGPAAAGGTSAPGGDKTHSEQIEAPSDVGITTVKEYTRLAPAAERLPKPKGTSKYQPLDENDNTVVFALNVWAGWGPIIYANGGFKAGKVWKTPDGDEFKVQLNLIDNAIVMRDAYTNGDVHIGWATLDMIPLFMEGFVDEQGKPIDNRVMPRVFQQVDFSNGGDGIVVRENVKTVADLSGKQLALARNSPSHFFALNMLVAGGVQPSDVKMEFFPDAFQAAAAFNTEKQIAGAVSWAPDIYNLEKVRGNRMLVTTRTANKLIADVWFARADFATDHPGIIEALVRGIFDGMEKLKSQEAKQQCAEWMSQGYNIPAGDTLNMFGDAHSTNWAENYQFFMNQNNPANFERIWNQAYYLYRQVGSITNRPVPFEQVMDDSIIKKLGEEEKYRKQKDEYRVQFTPQTAAQTEAELDEVVTKTIVIHFFPNSWDLEKKINHEVDGKTIEERYDPNVDFVLKEVGALAAQFGAARIVIEGHTDDSMKDKVPADLVKELSLNRANAVKEALVRKYKNLDPNQFGVLGAGWDRPADPNDKENHAKNRRVEIKVYSAEKAGG